MNTTDDYILAAIFIAAAFTLLGLVYQTVLVLMEDREDEEDEHGGGGIG